LAKRVERLQYVETPVTGWKPVPLENDRTNLRHELSCNYISQLSISVLLASPSVVAGLLAGFKPTYTVTINVQRFELVKGDAALVDAVWAVRSATGGKTESGRTIAREAVQGEWFDALAAAHSRAIAKPSSDIAAAIRTEAARNM
jgi:uncharacterized lipoprotein YmbA